MSGGSMEYILTGEQFAFMQRYHEIIEYSMFSHLIGGHSLIDAIMTWPEWKSVFGAMGWDDAYDRYECTPGYDNTFYVTLITWITENPQLRHERSYKRKSPPSNDHDSIDFDEDLTGVEMLIRLRDQQKETKQSDLDKR
jgi:hypothetical protein